MSLLGHAVAIGAVGGFTIWAFVSLACEVKGAWEERVRMSDTLDGPLKTRALLIAPHLVELTADLLPSESPPSAASICASVKNPAGGQRISKVGAVAVNRNDDLIAGLRDIADWLEAHPELPEFRGLVSTYPYGNDARETLRTVAAALGDRATEFVEATCVFIAGEFGMARVRASTPLDVLGAVAPPPTPSYEPIIDA